jgi:ATP-dependent DNA helicase RecQ
VDDIYVLLRRFGVPARRYHGRMTATQRNEEQKEYMRPRRRCVMVATSAFGLGIDKPDVRYVLHAQSPASLEQYVQEAGRAGRDGRRANCILLHDPTDRRIHEALLARSRVRPEQLYKLGKALAAWSQQRRNPTLEALALSAELEPRVTAALLAKLEEADLAAWRDSEIRVAVAAGSIEAETRRLAGQFETLRTQDARRLDGVAAYAEATDCRARFLRDYFGEEDDEACGLCDICRGRTERPAGFWEPLTPPRQRGKRPARRTARGRKGRPAAAGRGRGRKRP